MNVIVPGEVILGIVVGVCVILLIFCVIALALISSRDSRRRDWQDIVRSDEENKRQEESNADNQ